MDWDERDSKLGKTETIIQRKEMVQLEMRDRNRAQKFQSATNRASEHYTKTDEKTLKLEK